jgi:hypothetical protein
MPRGARERVLKSALIAAVVAAASARAAVIAICLFTALTGSLLFAVSGASGHAPGAVLYGAGTATIDGSLSPGEWDGARRLDLAARLPAHDGGATIPATIRAMNDGTTLYVSLQVGRATYGGSTSFALYFDNDHDGIREAGDDAFLASVGMFSPVYFLDWHWNSCVPGGPGLECPDIDANRSGSSEGASAAGIGGGSAVLEASHPLNSADDGHDFSLGPGSVVGFAALVSLYSADTTCNFGDACYAHTPVPIGIPSHGTTSGYGNLVISPDSIPPETSFTDGIADGVATRVRSASFVLSGEDNLTPAAELRLLCSLDGSALSDCGQRPTYAALADGRHRLEARAADELGNVDATPAVRQWRVDATAPTRPRVRVRVRGLVASVRLAAVDAAGGRVRYRCSLDGNAYRACTASARLRIKRGQHVLRAIALDVLGNRSKPGSARFRTRGRRHS